MDNLVGLRVGLTRCQRKILCCHWKSNPDFLVEECVSWSVYQLRDPVRTELSRLVENHCYVSMCNALRSKTIFTPRRNSPPGRSVPICSWNCITIPSDGPCFRKQLLHNRLRHKRCSFVMRTEVYTSCARLCLTFISIYLHQIHLHMPHKICTAVKQRLYLSSTGQHTRSSRATCCPRKNVVLHAESLKWGNVPWTADVEGRSNFENL
jgi:hypothetical protein